MERPTNKPECEPSVMRVPVQLWEVGQYVRRLNNDMEGQILARTYNNFYHATQWRYRIKWENGSETYIHYCNDLIGSRPTEW